MGKKKGRVPVKSGKNYKSVVESDDEIPERQKHQKFKQHKHRDYSSSSDNSEDEDFRENKDMISLGGKAVGEDDSDSFSETEEILPLADSDSDDEELDSYAIKAKKDEMESDLESGPEEGDLPALDAWGKKKSAYYNTDYVDKDFRKYLQKDEEAALAEEEEALAAQRRLLENITDNDLGFDVVEEAEEVPETLKSLQEAERVEVDMSKLSKDARLKLLKKTFPEMIPLIEDFQAYLSEAHDTLEPILRLPAKEEYKFLSEVNGFQLLDLKYHLLLRCATNIGYYMMLRAKKMPTKGHPVLKRIASYKKLIKELELVQQKSNLSSEIEELLNSLEKGEKLHFHEKRKAPEELDAERPVVIMNPAKKVKFAPEKLDETIESASEDEDDFFNDSLFADAEEAEEQEEGELANEKRGITYEMEKNKGLTAKKKKELRNPRVKHRMKYRKALIRRKGQVRPPRKEVAKYTGEISGIRSGVVKSVKFK